MLLEHSLADSCLEALGKSGAEKAQCILRVKDESVFRVKAGKVELLRTTENQSLTLTAILEDRKGTIRINRLKQDWRNASSQRW